MTTKDRDEFESYLEFCTESQVYGCLAKELEAGRLDYARLCERELQRRGLRP